MSIPVHPTPPQHPAWCWKSQCSIAEPHGEHRSRPMTLETGSLGVTVVVEISQGSKSDIAPNGDVILVGLEIRVPAMDPDDTDEDFGVVLRPETARSLGRMLASAGRLAMNDERSGGAV